MRLLFYKSELAWPRVSGHDVHAFNMMRALRRLGATVGLVTLTPPGTEALGDLDLDMVECLAKPAVDRHSPLSGLQERYRSYWGVKADHINSFGSIARRYRADVVVVTGLEVLPMLGAIDQACRVWYAADEWFWHHASQLKLSDPSSWASFRAAAIKGLYERAFRTRIDRAWVVSSEDARAMRWIAGVSCVDVVPNGVDFDSYQPVDLRSDPLTAVFWGRLDFGPNIQALSWFCRRVWPTIRSLHPTARFTIVGFSPTKEVEALARLPGVFLRRNVPDIRPEVSSSQVVVLPFVSGGGIKNKLLEAAAMQMPIVCSSRALLGLYGTPPLLVANTPMDWIRALSELWLDDARRLQIGRDLRAWVVREHAWERTARTAMDALGLDGSGR